MTAAECLLDRGGESKTKNCLICSMTPVSPYSTMHEGDQCFPFMFVQHIIKTIEQSSHPQQLLQRPGPESTRKKPVKLTRSCALLRTDVLLPVVTTSRDLFSTEQLQHPQNKHPLVLEIKQGGKCVTIFISCPIRSVYDF